MKGETGIAKACQVTGLTMCLTVPFQKYINNDRFPTLVEGKEGKFCELVEKAEALSHFTYQKSEKLILFDIQGIYMTQKLPHLQVLVMAKGCNFA